MAEYVCSDIIRSNNQALILLNTLSSFIGEPTEATIQFFDNFIDKWPSCDPDPSVQISLFKEADVCHTLLSFFPLLLNTTLKVAQTRYFEIVKLLNNSRLLFANAEFADTYLHMVLISYPRLCVTSHRAALSTIQQLFLTIGADQVTDYFNTGISNEFFALLQPIPDASVFSVLEVLVTRTAAHDLSDFYNQLLEIIPVMNDQFYMMSIELLSKVISKDAHLITDLVGHPLFTGILANINPDLPVPIIRQSIRIITRICTEAPAESPPSFGLELVLPFINEDTDIVEEALVYMSVYTKFGLDPYFDYDLFPALIANYPGRPYIQQQAINHVITTGFACGTREQALHLFELGGLVPILDALDGDDEDEISFLFDALERIRRVLEEAGRGNELHQAACELDLYSRLSDLDVCQEQAMSLNDYLSSFADPI